MFQVNQDANSQSLDYIKFIKGFSEYKGDRVRVENIYKSEDSLNWRLFQQAEYDTFGRLIRLMSTYENAEGYGTDLFFYDDQNRLVKIVDSSNNLLYRTGVLTYDINGRLTKIKYTSNPGYTAGAICITEFIYTYKGNLLFEETYLQQCTGTKSDTVSVTTYDSLGDDSIVKNFQMDEFYYFHWSSDRSSMVKTFLSFDGRYQDTALVNKYENGHLVESYNPQEIAESRKIYVWKNNKLYFMSGGSQYDISNFFDSSGRHYLRVSTINPKHREYAVWQKLPLVKKEYFKYSNIYFER